MRSILITYMNNHDFKVTMEAKVALQKTVEEMEAQGKELNMEAHFTTGTISTFTDGSQIVSMPIDQIALHKEEYEFTDIYISDSLRNLNPRVSEMFAKDNSIKYFTVKENNIIFS